MSCLTLDIYNNLKQTPLHLAVITEQAHIVGKLTTAGANVNLPDRNGQTPAHLACQRSSIECIQELFKGANVVDLELRNFNGFTALHQAVFSGCPEAVCYLVEHGANVNCKVLTTIQQTNSWLRQDLFLPLLAMVATLSLTLHACFSSFVGWQEWSHSSAPRSRSTQH